jgi:hypothetical protein
MNKKLKLLLNKHNSILSNQIIIIPKTIMATPDNNPINSIQVVITPDGYIIPNCPYNNYEEALEAINSINYDVSNILLKKSCEYAYPVDRFVQFMVKSAFMTGKKVVDFLTLGCSILDPTNDIDLQFFTNYIKVSKQTDISFNTFRTCLHGSIDFFSNPEKFYLRHTTGATLYNDYRNF